LDSKNGYISVYAARLTRYRSVLGMQLCSLFLPIHGMLRFLPHSLWLTLRLVLSSSREEQKYRQNNNDEE
jgi:hypothetical protein